MFRNEGLLLLEDLEARLDPHLLFAGKWAITVSLKSKAEEEKMFLSQTNALLRHYALNAVLIPK